MKKRYLKQNETCHKEVCDLKQKYISQYYINLLVHINKNKHVKVGNKYIDVKCL